MTALLEEPADQTLASPECYARLQFNVGPGVGQELAVEIDYSQPFAGADWEAWDEEYLANVQALEWLQPRWCDEQFVAPADVTPQAWRDAWHGYSDEEFQEMFAHE